MRYVARQPIMDKEGKVLAYELLFRAGPESQFRGDGNQATRIMLDNTLLLGLEKLTGGMHAFINCTYEALTEGFVDTLPPSRVVIEVLESVEPTQELIDACTRLKLAGFRIALDDFVWRPEFEPLFQIADIIKVDFQISDALERQSVIRRIQTSTQKLLAEKVETQEQFRQACKEGFSLFQGYYFCRPELIESRTVPPNRMSQLSIMEMLHRKEINRQEIAEQLKMDASITYRLLRLANSPLYAIRHQVQSIDAALLIVGEEAFRHLATLAITCEMNEGKNTEVLRMAFVRGRFCEISAGIMRFDSAEQYLLGMLSLFPSMLQMSIDRIASALPLRLGIKEALTGSKNTDRVLLDWIEYNENGDWKSCDHLCHAYGFDQDEMIANYADSILWAEEALGSAL